jgi:hypothetical protein
MFFLTTVAVAEAQAPTAAPPTTSPSMSPPPGTLHAPTSGSTVKTSTAAPTGHTLAKYKTEAEAKQACAGDTVVWANTSSKSKALHASGDKYYGHTKRGAYVCQSAAQNVGYHLAK